MLSLLFGKRLDITMPIPVSARRGIRLPLRAARPPGAWGRVRGGLYIHFVITLELGSL